MADQASDTHPSLPPLQSITKARDGQTQHEARTECIFATMNETATETVYNISALLTQDGWMYRDALAECVR